MRFAAFSLAVVCAACGRVGFGSDAAPGSSDAASNDAASNDAASTDAAVGEPPVVQYWLDEADTGQAPTVVRDSTPDPLDLTVEYIGGSPRWETGMDGERHLVWSGDIGTDTGGAAADIAGTEVDRRIHGATAATLELKYRVDRCQDLAGVFEEETRFFGLGDSDSAAGSWLTARIWSGEAVGVRFTGTLMWSVFHDVDMTCRSIARATVTHWVVDSTRPVDTDRVRWYVDGARSALTADGSGWPARDDTIDLGGGTRRIYLGRAHTALRTFEGRIWYAAIYDRALSEAEIGRRVTELSARDDP